MLQIGQVHDGYPLKVREIIGPFPHILAYSGPAQRLFKLLILLTIFHNLGQGTG